MNEPVTSTLDNAGAAPPPPRRTRTQVVWAELKKAPWTAKFGLCVIALYVFCALFAPWLAPYGEAEIVGSEFELWGEEFIFGTDALGRDILTRK